MTYYQKKNKAPEWRLLVRGGSWPLGGLAFGLGSIGRKALLNSVIGFAGKTQLLQNGIAGEVAGVFDLLVFTYAIGARVGDAVEGTVLAFVFADGRFHAADTDCIAWRIVAHDMTPFHQSV